MCRGGQWWPARWLNVISSFPPTQGVISSPFPPWACFSPSWRAAVLGLSASAVLRLRTFSVCPGVSVTSCLQSHYPHVDRCLEPTRLLIGDQIMAPWRPQATT